ncbi:MAG: AMP-binding protein, partial [Rubrivivax sp.]
MTANLTCANSCLAGAEVDALAARCATSLRQSGVGEGDTVGLLLRNEPRMLAAILAARLMGAYAVPVNWHFRAEEAGAIFLDSGMRLLFAHASLLEGVRDALPADLALVVLDDTPALVQDY